MLSTKKIPVAILGATGMVGQKFVDLLSNHPWFRIVALAASERSVNRRYKDCIQWMQETPLDYNIGRMYVQSCDTIDFPAQIIFSALDSNVAEEIEAKFANAGYIIISNSKNHRMYPDIPLLIPEVNKSHLGLGHYQNYTNQGKIITNPNCAVVGLTMALKPLDLLWGVESVYVVTLQAISGAGFPGIASLEILDNIIPHISGEEEKIESEPKKILGSFSDGRIIPHQMQINAQCNRVPVLNGHLECVTIKLRSKTTSEQIIDAWNSYPSYQLKDLPSAPEKSVIYFDNPLYPQPRKHRDLGNGMTVSIGKLHATTFDRWKFVLLSHNTIRGAAGGAILNAELLISKQYKWLEF